MYEGWADDFRHCMKLREDADYKGVYSNETAKEVIKSAQRFLKIAQDMIKIQRKSNSHQPSAISH